MKIKRLLVITLVIILTLWFSAQLATAEYEEAKLQASDGEAGHGLGCSVAIDDITIVAGARYDDTSQCDYCGSAYVFVHSGTELIDQQKLIAGDGARDDHFGCSVAISGDTIVVGASYDDDYGSAYVFVRSGSTWSLQQKLRATDGEIHDYFGSSVDISYDTIVVGAPRAEAAYVFVRSGSTWSLQQKLIVSWFSRNNYFGSSVAISLDTIVVGARYDDPDDTSQYDDRGSAYVFVRSDTKWTLQAKLLASDGAPDDHFGYSVAISGDTIVVGAENDDDNGANSGSAYVFSRDYPSNEWSQQDKLLAGDGLVGDLFGRSVAIRMDIIRGCIIVVGAENDDDNGANSGSAYVFSRDYEGTEWSQQDKLLASDGEEASWFGCSVAISADKIVIGSIGSDSAYVFTSLQPPPNCGWP